MFEKGVLYQAWHKGHWADQETSASQKRIKLVVALKVPLGLSLVPP